MCSTIRLKDKYINLKILVFIFAFFPYLMHLYWHIFDLTYFENILIPIGILFFIGIFFTYYEGYLKLNTSTTIFMLFAILFFINSLIIRDFKFFFQFSIYIFLFYTVYSRFYADIYYKLFINIVTFFGSISFVIYIIVLFTGTNDLIEFKNAGIFFNRDDWRYSIPYYLSVIPINSFSESEYGILGIPRFFGLSEEPTGFSSVILPTLIMAIYYKKYYATCMLLIILLVSSAYSALIIGLIVLLYIVFFNYKILISFLIVFSGIIFFNFASNIDSSRIELYINLFSNIKLIEDLTLFANNIDPSISVPSALLSLTLKYGLLVGVLHIYLYCFYIYLSLKTDKILFIFFLSSVLILNKGGLIFTPLFFFFLGFVDFQYSKNNFVYKS